MNYFAEVLPLIIVAFVVCFGYIKGLNIFSVFTQGAKQGLYTSLQIMPTLIGIVTAITMLRTSGALDSFINILSPALEKISFPSELLPLAILKPISGSGSNSAVIDIFGNYGPDSFIGMSASVMACSTDTSFYAISVYLGHKSYKSLSYTVPIALLGDLLTVILSVFIVHILFF